MQILILKKALDQALYVKLMVKKVNKFERSKAKLKNLSFAHLLPNMATVIALCIGLSSIRFALLERYDYAVIAIIIAAFFDAMDGRLARLLGAASDFGAELDSLSDFISFGVAPAVVLYILSMHVWAGLGWTIILFFVVCCGLRLARFNTNLRSSTSQEAPVWSKKFFIGVPAPAGAMTALLPLILYQATEYEFFLTPFIMMCFLVSAGVLFISRLPTYSFKTYQIPPKCVPLMLVFVGLLVASLVSAPWPTFSCLIVAYLISLIFSYRNYQDLLGETPSKIKSKNTPSSENE